MMRRILVPVLCIALAGSLASCSEEPPPPPPPAVVEPTPLELARTALEVNQELLKNAYIQVTMSPSLADREPHVERVKVLEDEAVELRVKIAKLEAEATPTPTP